jgi:VanZ family protein
MLKLLKSNILSLSAALVVMYLSLANSNEFESVPLLKIPNFDKVVHFGMYFFLMIVIACEHRHSLKSRRSLFLAALIPVSYGILMEIFQLFTLTRSGDIIDGVADIMGVVFAVIIWMLVGSRIGKTIS